MSLEATWHGRLFKANGERLTFSPFGDLDFLCLPEESDPILDIHPHLEAGVLVITTAHRGFELSGSDPLTDWKLLLIEKGYGIGLRSLERRKRLEPSPNI